MSARTCTGRSAEKATTVEGAMAWGKREKEGGGEGMKCVIAGEGCVRRV